MDQGNNKNIKASRVTGTRERAEQTILIRKQKRLQQLKKRRQGRKNSPEKSQTGAAALPGPAFQSPGGQASPTQQQQPGLPQTGANVVAPGVVAKMPGPNDPISLAYLDTYVAGVHSGNPALQLECTRRIRKLLSKEENPPAAEIIKKQLIPHLVEFLKKVDNPKLQFEAAWALTNIASTEHTHFITRNEPPLMRNAVPFLAQLMRSNSPDVREQSCWCLGNVAGDGWALRDIVLGTKDCLRNLMLNITKAHNDSMLKNATWALSNFCRGKPQPKIDVIKEALPVLRGLIMSKNEEVLRDACWAFSYISDGDDDRIQAVLSVNPTPRLVQLLSHYRSAVVTPALRSLGNIISGNDGQTQHALSNGALAALIPLLHHEKINIRKEACWTLSNIAAGTADQARQLVTARDATGRSVICRIIELTNGGHYDVRKEAAWVIANVCTGGDVDNIRRIVDSQPTSGIFVLCQLLGMDDPRMLLVGLEALEAILSRGKPRPGQRYDTMIEENGGRSQLEALCTHSDSLVFAKALHIMRTFFNAASDGEDSDEDDMNGLGAFGPQ